MEKMDSNQVIAHFQGRAPEYIKKARKAFESESMWDSIPLESDAAMKVVDALWWAKRRFGPINTMIEFGCGAGQWIKFLWSLGIISYLGIDSSPVAMEAARKMWSYGGLDFALRDITTRFKCGPVDLGFTSGLLMHIPCDKIKQAVQNIQAASRFQVIIETTRLPKPRKQGGPHVFLHDYPELFGKPVCAVGLNQFKDLFVFGG